MEFKGYFRIIRFAALLLITQSCYARVNFHKLTSFPVYINAPDSSIKATVLNSPGRIKPKQGAHYYWYGNNAIHTTNGGFSGRLLHGSYFAYYPNHNLKSQGCFDHGLKTGKWITWYPSGEIHEVIRFSGGKPHGEYEVYDESGNLTVRTNYRHGKKHGKTTYYTLGQTDSTTCYKNGIMLPDKECADSTRTLKFGRTKKKDTIREKSGKGNDSIRRSDSARKKRSRRDSVKGNEQKERNSKPKRKLRDFFHLKQKQDAKQD